MKNGAFNTTFMTGDDYAKWVAGEEKRHQELMKEAGFLRPQLIDQSRTDELPTSSDHGETVIADGDRMTTNGPGAPARCTRRWKPASRC